MRLKKGGKLKCPRFLLETQVVKKWKWEFLRRNKEYQNDYDTFAKINIEKKGNNPEEVREYFKKKWSTWPQDYRLGSAGLLLDEPFSALSLTPEIEFIKKKKNTKTLKDFMSNLRLIPEERLAKTNFIEVRINLRCHKIKIMDELGKIVDEWQERKRQHGALNIKSLRIKDWEFYLKIYNLKEKNKKDSFKQIAAKHYCRRTSEVIRGDEDRIAKAYKACLEMINGGYRKISL